MGLNKGILDAVSEHKEKVSGPHFIFSAENPKYPQKNTVGMNHDQTLTHLRGAGYDAHPVHGHYGSPEKSIIVYGVNNDHVQHLHGLASRLGQDSSIHSDGKNHTMVFHHGDDAGKQVHGSGTVWHAKKPADFYTSLPGNAHHFTHNFNFESELPMASGMKKSEVSRIGLVHYSNKGGLKEIDPKYKGTGKANKADKNAATPFSFFYREHSEPEDLIANHSSHKYKASIHPDEQKVYDLGEDHEGHVKAAVNENDGILDMDRVHGKLKDHGYKGFFNSKHPHLHNVIGMYEPVKVEADERTSKFSTEH